MAYQLSVPSPLPHPQRFEQAHRLVIWGLEVLDRNGGRKPSTLPKLGPLKPAASSFIQLITRYIVRSHQVNVAPTTSPTSTRARRTAAGEATRCTCCGRFQAERLAPGYKRKSLGLRPSSFGGAVLSGAVGALQAFGDILAEKLILVLTTLLLFGLFILTSFGILYSADISRRRIRVSIAQPLAALYETIGACGNPPKDQARTFRGLHDHPCHRRRVARHPARGRIRDRHLTTLSRAPAGFSPGAPMTALPAGFRSRGERGHRERHGQLVVIAADRPCAAAAVFTKSRFSGPSVVLSRWNVSDGQLRAYVVISKNANVATGPGPCRRRRSRRRCRCRAIGLRSQMTCSSRRPASSGGRYPMDRDPRPSWPGSTRRSRSTTPSEGGPRDHDDRHVREGRVRSGGLGGLVVGIAKGVGMIEPDMATLIALFLTDAAIEGCESTRCSVE